VLLRVAVQPLRLLLAGVPNPHPDLFTAVVPGARAASSRREMMAGATRDMW
jgi:hypothetical protein